MAPARQRSLAGGVHGRRRWAATSTRSRDGSIGSRPGGTSSRRSSAPARTSRASCSKAPRSSARRRLRGYRAERAGQTVAAAAHAGTAGAVGRDPRRYRALAGARVVIALEADLARDGARADRSRATRYDRVLEVIVERERARFGAWYEMFPRSAGTDPSRSATFDEAAARLPYIAAMGFDVLYLPPIHPIGRSFRKGPNNTLDAGPGDPGSPWAIGIGERRAHGDRAGARHARRLRPLRRRRARGTASRSRSTSPSRPRPTIPTCANTRSGSATAPTARSSTPRTRPRSTRTSIRSTSSRTTGRRSGSS